MNTPPAASFKAFFSHQPQDDDGNKNTKAFTDALDDADEGRRIRNFTEDLNSIFFAADAEGKIQTLHSPKNLGGTRTRSTHKIVALVGMGARATAVQLDEKHAVKVVDLRCPNLNLIDVETTAAGIKAIPIPDDNAVVTCETTNIFLPAPWLKNAILVEDTVCPFELILVSHQASGDFIQNHCEGDQDLQSEIKAHHDAFVSWAWGVGHGKIEALRLLVRPDDGELKAHEVEIHASAILPPVTVGGGVPAPTDTAAVMQQLTASLSKTSEETANANQLAREVLELKREKEETSKNRLKKLHGTVTTLIRNAASNDDERPAPNVPESCQRFYKCESAGMADQELTYQFQERKLGDVSFAHGTVQQIWNGSYLYASHGSPSNFSAFCFTQRAPLQQNQEARGVTLHLISSQGHSQTIEEIVKATKQTVTVPTKYHELGSQIAYFKGGTEIFFGEKCVLADGLGHFINDLEENRQIFMDAAALDEFFCAKILFAIDFRAQRWMGQCRDAKEDRSTVDDGIVDFSDITEQVLNGNFDRKLPPTFKTKTPTQQDNDRDDSLPPQKRSKKEEESKRRQENITNPGQCEEFKMKDDEDWSLFKNRKTLKWRPAWDDKCKMCPRWHSRGDCFPDCNNAASHVTYQEIPDEKKASYRTYLKKLRKEA
mmetsp:Transcript_30867/g.65029  ORF Transcript_30867/g.65029 Transcript_30867/m.65029 type:complete len:658 (+) Transcript_30867:779-2752(+)